MAHDGHFFKCNYCGYVGLESELQPDPNGHECGSDTCPECKVDGFITCCFLSEKEAETKDTP
jgi:hypothetical protein